MYPFSTAKTISMKNFSFLIISLLSICLLGSCSNIASRLQHKKVYNLQETPLSKVANQYFWTNLHKGKYDSLTTVISILNAAYLENPGNLKIIDHLGFANIWRYAESQRLNQPTADILQSFVLSRHFFDESYLLNPADSRILGFLGDTKITEGKVTNNRQLVVEGYFDGIKSIHEWPQFNKFTLGYVLSQNPAESDEFKKALKWQWETLADCSCKTINKSQIDYKELVRLIVKTPDPAIRRACMNSWIAPHNVEGFFMNLGDMLVKKGDLQKGIEAYKAARLSPAYPEWPYAGELEQRIIQASANKTNFNSPINHRKPDHSTSRVMMVNSKMACMSCHQMGDAEFLKYGYQEPTLAFYQGKGN